MAKKKKPKTWIMLNTRPEHNCRAKADRLAGLVAAELGVSVVRADAIKVALEESLEKRRAPRKQDAAMEVVRAWLAHAKRFEDFEVRDLTDAEMAEFRKSYRLCVSMTSTLIATTGGSQ